MDYAANCGTPIYGNIVFWNDSVGLESSFYVWIYVMIGYWDLKAALIYYTSNCRMFIYSKRLF